MTEAEPMPSVKIVCEEHGVLAETATMERFRDLSEHHHEEGCEAAVYAVPNTQEKTKQDWGITWD